METTEKVEIVERILARAADELGDVTALVLENYYRRHPAADAAFDTHSRHDDRARLEGLMVENSLYCLMYWYQSPSEVKIMLEDSVPHHQETLQIPSKLYSELIDVTAEIIAETLPPGDTPELMVWRELRNELKQLIDSTVKK